MSGASGSTGSRLKRDIWRMVDGPWYARWGASVERNGVGYGLRYVSLPRAVWHVLTFRRPDEAGAFIQTKRGSGMNTPGTPRRSWPIRLRLRLLLPFDCRWNGWVRDLTARMERGR